MKEITLKVLIEKGIIDENQKIWIYEYHDNIKSWVTLWKGYAYSLMNEKIDFLNQTKDFTIQEIRRDDLQYLIDNNFKKDYIGIYLG